MSIQIRIPFPVMNTASNEVCITEVVRMLTNCINDLTHMKNQLSDIIENKNTAIDNKNTALVVIPKTKDKKVLSPEQKVKQREYGKKYYETHKEEFKRRAREYYLKNKSKKSATINHA